MIQQFFFYNFLTYIINILLIGTFLVYILYIFLINSKQQILTKNDYGYNIVKNLLILILGVSFFLFLLFLFYFYRFYKYGGFYYIHSTFLILPNIHINFFYNWFEFSIDFFGIVLLLLGYFIGILSLLALDNRVFWKNIKFLFIMNSFILVVYFYVFSTNVLLFFLFYEFLLVPSFLVVFYISPSRRAIQASLYFLIWTQIGSFLVLITIAYIISIVGSSSFFDIKTYSFSKTETFYILLLLFFGFGFKVPI